ncbi:hypothetical protein RUND412_000422 [Rhizina undulata]
MIPSQRGSQANGEIAAPLVSPTGCEFYLVIPLDPALQLDTGSKRLDALDSQQIVAIANLLKERKAITAGDGQWALSGLRMVSGSEEFSLKINFRRYSDDFGDSRKLALARKADEKGPNNPTEVLAEIAITTAEEAETAAEISRIEVIISTIEEAEKKIFEGLIQQPDSLDSDLDSTVGPGSRSPTPATALGSGTSTPVPSVIVRTLKERQIHELDGLEEAACKLSESMNGGVIALSILNGVLQAPKILMGEVHF